MILRIQYKKKTNIVSVFYNFYQIRNRLFFTLLFINWLNFDIGHKCLTFILYHSSNPMDVGCRHTHEICIRLREWQLYQGVKLAPLVINVDHIHWYLPIVVWTLFLTIACCCVTANVCPFSNITLSISALYLHDYWFAVHEYILQSP